MKNILTTLLTCLLTLSTQAHSRTEIGFKILEKQEKTFLEVHLTSVTVFDLLYSIYPELEQQPSLDLDSYATDYEIYFNQILDLELNGKDQSLAFVESNLIIHDAFMRFEFTKLKEPINSYDITVNGFQFYQKPTFNIWFETATINDVCSLSKTENNCSGVDATSKADRGWANYWLLGILMIVVVGVGVVVVRRGLRFLLLD